MACFPTSKASCRFPITAVISPMACWLQVRRAGWFWGVNHTRKNVRQIVLPSDHHYLWNETRKNEAHWGKWHELLALVWSRCTSRLWTRILSSLAVCGKFLPYTQPLIPKQKKYVSTNTKTRKIHQDLVEIADGDIAQLRILSDDFL